MSRIDCDVAVIGSGAGGGTVVAALAELARAGKRVILFEKGTKLDRSRFNGREVDMAELLFEAGGSFPVVDHSVTLAFSEGVGGSTQVYTGTSLLPPKRVIERWNLPGVDHADLCERAEAFRVQNNAHLLPGPDINDNNRLFQKGCEALGWHAEQFPVNVKGCKGSSLCNLGCPNDAKMGTQQVQIPAARAAGVELVTRAKVRTVRAGDAGGILDVEVSAAPHPHGKIAQSEWEPGRYEVHAHTVVVAGGAVHSPALLLRSGFGLDLPVLGRYWTCQPAHILVGEHDKPLTNAIGHPKSFLYDQRVAEDRYFVEACMYFPFVTAKNLTGFGPEHHRLLKAYERLQMILVLACDDALPDQRVTIDAAGEPVVHYKLMPPTITALCKATRAAAQIFFAAGALAVHAPSARPTLLTRADKDHIDARISERHFLPGSVSVSAAHLMGGCRMGTTTATSVTTPHGQVHGQPWLYVADASLFPTAIEVNPYLTVMALADHVAQAVLARESH